MDDEQVKTDWKVGDWCFNDFELCVIESIDPERGVTSVSSGYVVKGGWSHFCVPLSKEAKRWSDAVKSYESDVRRAAGTINLNWPDIHRKYEAIWTDGCEHLFEPDVEAHWIEVRGFTGELLEAIKSMREPTVHGVRVLR